MRPNLVAIITLAAFSVSSCAQIDGDGEPPQAELEESPQVSADDHPGCLGVEVDAPRTLATLEQVDGILAANVQWSDAHGSAELALAMEAEGQQRIVRRVDRAGASGDGLVELVRASELDLPREKVVHLTLQEIDEEGMVRPLDTHGFYAFQGNLYTEKEWQTRSLEKLNGELMARGDPPVEIEVIDMGEVDLDAEPVQEHVPTEEEDTDEN